MRMFIWFCTCVIALLGPMSAAPAAAPTGHNVATAPAVIVTHDLSVAQLREDFQRLRFSLEHAHPAPSRYTPKAEIDGQLNAIERQLNRPMTDLAFYRMLAPLIAAIRNSHTSIVAPPDALASMHASHDAFPFVLRFVDGRAFIDVNLSADATIRPGMELVELNGRPLAVTTRTLMAARSAEGFVEVAKYAQLDRAFSLDLLLQIGPSARYVVTVRDPASGHASRHDVAGVSLAAVVARTPQFPATAGPPQSITLECANDLALMRLQNFLEPDTDAFFRQAFHQIAGCGVGNLIIDIRGNHGGIDWFNSDLLSYLSDRPFRFYRNRTCVARSYDDLRYLSYKLDDFLFPDQIAALPASVRAHPFDHWTLPQLIDLALSTDHAGGMQTPKAKDHFSGRVYLLVDGNSGSSASEVPALMHHLGLATIIGEEPNGSYQGEVAGFIPDLTLPNSKIVIRMPLIAYQSDVMPGVRNGRAAEPTFTVSESVSDSVSGIDTVMAFTRALIRSRTTGMVSATRP
ncbi:MAG: S41 family peptidase [Sphingomonas sp.]